jgi:hypothetical protein
MKENTEMVFLSEYCGQNKTAWVCQRKSHGDFATVAYSAGVEKLTEIFATEADAEDFAEDWVLLSTPE